jgi:hypothetical protein
MRSIENIFSEEELLSIRELPQVSAAYQRLSTQSSAYFSIPATDLIKQRLSERFGLKLEALSQIPCRWIKGDTPAHIDRGQRYFEDTYLVYLTDGEGEFHIDTESYAIQAGTGFSFSEGVSHEVVNTNGSARLLLGPMSEAGFPVGASNTLTADGATETIYLSQDGSTKYFRINDGELTVYTGAPVYIQNTNPSPASNILKVIFTTSLTMTDIYSYFIADSNGIQFGSTSLDSEGNKTNIIIDGVEQYPGVFQNGTSGASGYSNISIYNLSVSATNDAYLIIGGGWIAQSYFGKDAINNYIINCASDGPIESFGGGIVGLYAAYKNTATTTSLQVIGCNSTGVINASAGGIVGARCGYGTGGSCTVEQCWSTGEISSFAGGIVGQFAGQNSGSVTISKCYSTGGPALGNSSAGGICGSFAAFQSGVVTVEKSYSTGNIMQDGGGIYGGYAGDTSGTTTASNCYSSGTIATSGTGIFGSNKETGIATNCYSADGNWSDSTANTNLTGIPSEGNPGDTWSPVGTNQPYELVAFGATPYQTEVISGNELVQSKSQTVDQGSGTIEALTADASGNAFSILQITGGDSASYATITISAQTGKISTTSATAAGIYTISVRSVGSYYITTFVLSVAAYSSSGSTTCCKSTMDERDISYEWINDYRIGNRLIAEHAQNPNLKFNGYSEYVKYKMAQAQRRS